MILDLDNLFQRAFDDESLQPLFYYEMLQHILYVLGESDCEGDVLEEGTPLKLVTLIEDDEEFVPVFLSKRSMEIFLEDEEHDYFSAKGEELLETLKNGNIVINPGQQDTLALYAKEIQRILSQGKN